MMDSIITRTLRAIGRLHNVWQFKAQKPGSSIAEKAIQSMNRATFECLEILFRNMQPVTDSIQELLDTAQAVGEAGEQEAACDIDYDSDFSDMECEQYDNDMEQACMEQSI